ncbi:MAG: TRAP transporter substrate-binding protein [Chloroflexi bacterium]|nr:TRAP transporter substrate-binding protein [Chloroflexota bacterium]
MKRREFLSATAKSTAIAVTAGVAAACGTQLATPAVSPTALTAAATTAPGPVTVAAPTVINQAQPSFDWQMATSWPVSLDTIFGGAQIFADRVAAMTGGKFKITPRAAGELAPGTQVLDVVSQGAVPLGHTASYYYVGKSPVTAFGTALPFGLTAQQQNAWFYDGGGLKLLQDFYQKKFGVIQFPAGNTGAQLGGWFRKEIKTPEDLKGLKMRIPGLGGQVMTKLGVTVQVLAGGEIFQALQTGAVDAAEWVGPYDDEKLGFQKVAKYYYYPGWWEPGPSLEVEVNLNEWNKLPSEFQEALKTAAAQANVEMLARYDARNQKALQSLLSQGVELRPYSKEILQAASDAATALFDEFSGKDADFKAIFTEWKTFRDNVRAWNKVNEASFTNFVYGNA